MSRNVICVGVDVDDVRYHGCALDRGTGEALEFRCRATLKGLVGQLEKLGEHFGDIELKLCYEASYVGFSLQRNLHRRGYDCEGTVEGCALFHLERYEEADTSLEEATMRNSQFESAQSCWPSPIGSWDVSRTPSERWRRIPRCVPGTRSPTKQRQPATP